MLHQAEYESIFEDGTGAMTVSRGKIHKYLGMPLSEMLRWREFGLENQWAGVGIVVK
jgi:hypothetical protein